MEKEVRFEGGHVSLTVLIGGRRLALWYATCTNYALYCNISGGKRGSCRSDVYIWKYIYIYIYIWTGKLFYVHSIPVEGGAQSFC